MHNTITTRVDLVEQLPFKKQPPNLPQINYDQTLYSLHVQYAWQGEVVRFIGYLSPGMKYEHGQALDPDVNLILRRLIINDNAGKPVAGTKAGAPLMAAWEGDKLISIAKVCQELGIREKDISVYTRPLAHVASIPTDYEDIPQMKDLAELHEKVIPLMIENGMGAVKLRAEDGFIAILDMTPLGLAQGNFAGFVEAMKALLGNRRIDITGHAGGGSTFELHEGDKHYIQSFASFAM
jgi:hypothetical protein